ncbi:Ig-like domain-containing protein, partial [Aequorivita flava]
MKKQLHFRDILVEKLSKITFLLVILSSFTFFGQQPSLDVVKTRVANTTTCNVFDINIDVDGVASKKPQEVVLIIDRSGSMSYGNNPKPIAYAKDAAIDFVNELFKPENNPTGLNKVSLVSYSSSATVDQQLTTNKTLAIAKINALVTGGTTNIEDALVKARAELNSRGTFNCETSRSIILLTDGVANRDNNGNSCSTTSPNTICQQRAIAAGQAAWSITKSGVPYPQNVFTIGLTGAICCNEQTIALNTLDQIQNAGAYHTEVNADLSDIYMDIFGNLNYAAIQLPGQKFLTTTITPGFTIVPGSISTNKGTVTLSGPEDKIFWDVPKIATESLFLKYSLVATNSSVCGTQNPDSTVVKYEDSDCDPVTLNLTNPDVCVPCPSVTASIDQVSCDNSVNYSANFSSGDCSPPLGNVQWEFFLNNVSVGVSNQATGTYVYTGGGAFEGNFRAKATYTSTYASGCTLPSVTDEKTITLHDKVAATIEKVNANSSGNCNNGEATVTPTNGTGPYTYLWSANAGSQTTQTASGLAAGTYSVVVTDVNGCTVEKTISVYCDIEDWNFECGDDKIVDEYGYNANCNATTVANIPNPSNVYQYAVEIVYKDNNPGATLQFTDALGNPHTLERSVPVGSSSSVWVYRGLIVGSTSSITYTDNANRCKLQSVVVYAFRNVPNATSNSGKFTSLSGYNNIVNFTIDIPTFSGPRDLLVETPISEVTDDGRYLLVRATAGSVSNQTIIYGPDSNLPGGTCCLSIPSITLEDVPGNITQVTITVDTRNNQNGQSVNGQSWVIAGGVNVEANCYSDLELTLQSKTDILCYGDNTGSITVEATGGVQPYLYSINGGTQQSSATFNNLTAGVYVIEVEDAINNTESISVTLTQPDDIVVQITKQNASTSGACNNGEATASPSGGVPPFSYQWSVSAGSQTTATAVNLPEGTHQIEVTDANGCTVVQSVVIDCINDCDAVIDIDNVTHVLCKGDATGMAKVSASSQANPTAVFTFTWNTVPPQIDSGVTSSTITNQPSGVYTVSVTIDGTVCLPVEQSVTINEPSNALNVTATSTDESGPSTGDGTATANASGGTPPYTYSWSPGGQTTRIITGLSAGIYTVTVTDANGCTETATTTVNPGSCHNLSANPSSTPVSCNGSSDGSATVSVSNGVGPFTYLWSPGGETTQTITGLSAGNYTVTVTDQTTLCTVDATATVSQPNILSSGIAITSVSCFGGNNGSLDLTVLGGTQPYSFLWNNGATTEDLFNLTAGTYSVTITDANGCTTSNSATVLEPASALSLTYSVQDVLCYGNSTGSIDITVSGGTIPYQYNWSNGATTEDLSSIPAGVYSVTVTDANGCTLTENSITISEPANPISIIITKENATTGQGCNDGEATASPSGGVSPYTYLWSASAGNQTTATAVNLPAGTHSVTVTDSNGCELNQGVVIICDNTCDAVITVDQVTNVLCTGDTTGSASVSASSASNPGALFTFTWDTTPPQVDAGVTTSTVNNLGSGIYTVSVTIDGTVCQPEQQSITITEPASALSVSATSTDESGPATGDGTATANPVGGTPPYTYSWSPGGETTQTITGLSAGVYTVTVTDANGCTAVATTTVNPGTCRGLAAVANSTSVTCNGDSDGTATVSVTGGSGSFTYLWSPGGQTTQSISGLSAGSYSVVVTDTVTLCTVTASTIVNEPNVLTSGVAVTHVKCFGENTGSVDLTVSGGTAPYSFLWSNGATTEDIINLAAGTYSVTITDINGCTATNSATVLEPASGLTLAITSQTDIVCNGLGSVTVQASGGTIPYLYRIDGGAYQSSGTFNNLTAGSHTIDVLDANNCTAQVVVDILSNCIIAIEDINDTFMNLPVGGDVSTNDLNPDGPAGTEVFTLVTGPTSGTVVFNADGTYIYTPALDFVGADIFEYQICDGGNPIACDTAFVYIEVLNTTTGNDAPIANADTNTTETDIPVSGNVLVNDFDPDGDPISVTGNTNPTNGTVVVNPDGTYTYTPNAGFEGQDTFEYTICDSGTPPLCDTAVVTIQVIPNAGNITVANDDAYFGMPDTDITGNVLDNDSDPEGDNQFVDVAITPISGPANGVLAINADGTFIYTPNAGYTGTDQFVYGKVDDGTPVATDVATVYISIDPNNANTILAIE